MEKFYADIHCHPSMKPFRSLKPNGEEKDIWEDISDKNLNIKLIFGLKKLKNDKRFNELIKSSQTNFLKCKSGNARLLFLSIYPIEMQWFNLITDMISEKKKSEISAWASGIDISVVEEIMNTIANDTSVNYFDYVVKEYNYLVQQEVNSSSAQKMIIATNYQDISLLETQKNLIVVVLTIEGGSSLFNFKHFTDIENTFENLESGSQFDFYLDQLKTNIGKLKSWGRMVSGIFHNHTPLFISPAHHFWGLLCGHAESLKSGFLNQDTGMNAGFTQLGHKAIELLLSRDNGRRILIDIKHMSIQARRDFYNIWNNSNEKFPIICSHTGISGSKTLDDLEENKRKNRNEYFNSVPINLADEDILKIYNSEGLIGIILNEERLPGNATKEKLEPYITKFKKNNNPQLLEFIRVEYAKLILINMFKIIDVCQSEKAWNIICIGSDFDGMIDSLTGYEDISTFPVLEELMLSLLKQPVSLINTDIEFLNINEIKNLMFNFTAEEIIDKVFYKNVTGFLEKHYT